MSEFKCTLVIGIKRTEYDFKTGKDTLPQFTGNFERTNLKLKSVEDAIKIAEIANVDCYRIMQLNDRDDFYYRDKPLLETEDITYFNIRQIEDSEDFDYNQNQRVKLINKLPTIFELGDFGLDGLSVQLERSEYTYRKGYSKTLNGNVNFKIMVNNKVVDRYFSLDVFTSKNIRYLIKKFERYFFGSSGVYRKEKPKDFNSKKFLIDLTNEKEKVLNKIYRIKQLKFKRDEPISVPSL